MGGGPGGGGSGGRVERKRAKNFLRFRRTFVVNAEIVLREAYVVVLVLGAPGSRQGGLLLVDHGVEHLEVVDALPGSRPGRLHNGPFVAAGGHHCHIHTGTAPFRVRSPSPPSRAPPARPLAQRACLGCGRGRGAHARMHCAGADAGFFFFRFLVSRIGRRGDDRGESGGFEKRGFGLILTRVWGNGQMKTA